MKRQSISALLALAVVAMIGFGPMFVQAQESTGKPTTGYDLHIDAKYHFAGDGQAIAHHYCKQVAGGLVECQIYDGEGPDARLVGIEIVVDAATYQSFPPEEQALWHYHRQELPLVEATLPDLAEADAATVVESLQETYGKVYLLWDPTTQDMPMGEPVVVNIHANVMGGATTSPAP
jgi:hypothetical protein